MNREIKFRGLRFDGKGFVFGNLLSKSAIGEWGNCEVYSYYDVIPETVSQYIGLKDKNGKEIYEGDICSNYGGVVIEWRKDKCRYDFKYPVHLMSKQWMGGVDEYFAKTELEIIGNIHQNPELLS